MVKLQEKNIFDIAKETIFNKENSFSVVIPNFCNNSDVFSKGFLNDVASVYPQVKENYHLLGKNFLLKHPGYLQVIDVDREPVYNRRLIIANMIVNNGTLNKTNKRPINYAYLVKSMVDLKQFILRNFNSENKAIILFPKASIKGTGANFTFVSDLIKDIWNGIEVDVI